MKHNRTTLAQFFQMKELKVIYNGRITTVVYIGLRGDRDMVHVKHDIMRGKRNGGK